MKLEELIAAAETKLVRLLSEQEKALVRQIHSAEETYAAQQLARVLATLETEDPKPPEPSDHAYIGQGDSTIEIDSTGGAR